MSNRFLTSGQNLNGLATERTLYDIETFLESGQLAVTTSSTLNTITDVDTTSGGQTSNLGIIVNDTASGVKFRCNQVFINNSTISAGSGSSGTPGNSGTQRVCLSNDFVSGVKQVLATGTGDADYVVPSIGKGMVDSGTQKVCIAGDSDRIRIENPVLLFNSKFYWSENNYEYTYTHDSGSGVTNTFDSTRNCINIVTPGTSVSYSVYTKRKFNFSGTSSRVCVVIEPSFSGAGAATESIVIELVDPAVGANYVGIRLFNDGNHNFSSAGNFTDITDLGIASWNGNTTIASDLTKPCVFTFDINDHMIRIGEVISGQERYLHTIYQNEDGFPAFQCLALHLVFNASNVYTSRYFGATVIQNYIERPITAIRRSYYTPSTISMSATTSYAITGIRYNTGITGAGNIPVFLRAVSYGVTAASETWVMNIVRNPTIGGTPSWSSAGSNSALQTLDINVGNTVSGGEYVYSQFFDNTGGGYNSHSNLDKWIELYPDDTLCLVVYSITAQDGSGSIAWAEG